MTDKALQAEASAFFDAFVAAFRSFDGNTVAQRYAAPCLALDAQGAPRLLLTQADTACYFQTVLDGYLAQGCRSCRYCELETHHIGRQSATCTVTWELLDQQGEVLTRWRESYHLMRTDKEWRIFASVDHAP